MKASDRGGPDNQVLLNFNLCVWTFVHSKIILLYLWERPDQETCGTKIHVTEQMIPDVLGAAFIGTECFNI